MIGPFSLGADVIRRLITRKTAGYYMLSRSKTPSGTWAFDYCGRSDADLASRLESHVGNYSVFWYAEAANAREAYQAECRLWHKYSPRDNQVHPAAPANTGYKCPVPGCPFSRAA